jgi:hypothetical protein
MEPTWQWQSSSADLEQRLTRMPEGAANRYRRVWLLPSGQVGIHVINRQAAELRKLAVGFGDLQGCLPEGGPARPPEAELLGRDLGEFLADDDPACRRLAGVVELAADMQISTVNSPSTVAKGPLVAPQNEQCPASSVTGSWSRWPVAVGGRGSRPGPDHRRQAAAGARAASGSRPWSRRPEHRAPCGRPPPGWRRGRPRAARRTALAERRSAGSGWGRGLPRLACPVA